MSGESDYDASDDSDYDPSEDPEAAGALVDPGDSDQEQWSPGEDDVASIHSASTDAVSSEDSISSIIVSIDDPSSDDSADETSPQIGVGNDSDMNSNEPDNTDDYQEQEFNSLDPDHPDDYQEQEMNSNDPDNPDDYHEQESNEPDDPDVYRDQEFRNDTDSPDDYQAQEMNSNEAETAQADDDDLRANETGHGNAVVATRQREGTSGEPPAKIQKTNERADVADRHNQEDDGETCSICLDSWSNSGDHRLVALKCGHLFGHSCILRWLQSQPARDRQCPTCKMRAAVRDVRFLYARKLVAVDTSEIDALKQQLEDTISQKNRAELELRRSQISQRNTLRELTELNKMLNELKSAHVPERRSGRLRWHFALEKTLDIAQDASCRILAYNCRKYELYASQKSTQSLFPGYGIRRIDVVNFKLGQFMHVHPKPIRDMQYSPTNDLIMSVSLDKSAKLTCGQSNQVVNTVKSSMPLWACCWDVAQTDQFAVGGVGGVTLVYDLRNTASPLSRLTADGGDITPVVSLASTPRGLISCNFGSCRFYEKYGSEYRTHHIPIDGSLISMSYDDRCRQMLLSCRPTTGNPLCRHIVATLDVGNDDISCNIVHTFTGSNVQTLMSRSCQVRVGDEGWVAAHNESGACVSLYSTNSFRLAQSLATQDAVVDMRNIDVAGNQFLATLLSNKIRFYKAFSTSY